MREFADVTQPNNDARRRIKLNNAELIIFDCDGVLIDSEPIAIRTMVEALKEYGVRMTENEAYCLFSGCAESATRAFFRQQLDISDVNGFFDTFGKRLDKRFEVIKEIDGISDIITNLDCPICVGSNSTLHRLTRSLGRTELWLAFKGQIFSADHVVRPKPAPDLFLHCASQFNAIPARCINVDDSPHGVEAAVAAGMVAIGFVASNDPRPDRIGSLTKAGAHFVAFGAEMLRGCLEDADKLVGSLG